MNAVNEPQWSQNQSAAIHSRGQNVIVSAGAGSGKTSVLVERVVRCVVDDPPIDLNRLLVVTFTEAAAAEMKKRIGERLQRLSEQAAAAGNTDVYGRLTRQVAQLEQAQISTLHSFCMQVVRQNYLRLEIDPLFDILREEDAVILKTECLNQVMEEQLLQDGDTKFTHMLDVFGAGDPKAVYPLVFRLHTFAQSQAEPLAWLQEIRENYQRVTSDSQPPIDAADLPWYGTFVLWCRRQLADALDGFRDALSLTGGVSSLSAYHDNLNQAIPLILQALMALEQSDWTAMAGQLSAVQSLKSPRVKKDADNPLDEQLASQVKTLRTQALQGLKSLTEVTSRGMTALFADIEAMAPAIGELVGLVERFQVAFMALKQHLLKLDFNDLEHLAYAVLTDETTGEARRLQEQYVEIFVDEFQDTSPIQDAVVRAITRAQGNVFVVGDVKQSIYRFRMAEPGLFLDKYFGRDEDGGFKALYLAENYRSRREVVGAVNYIFSQLFSEEFGGAPYDDNAKMLYAARYPDEPSEDDLSGPVEVHLIERELPQTDESGSTGDPMLKDDGDGADDEAQDASGHGLGDGNEDGEVVSAEDLLAIEREGRVIANRIQDLMGLSGQAHRQVWDPRRQTYRPLQYRDIVILLRSVKGRMTPLLDVLRHQEIPAYGVTSTGFYGALETQWLLSLLATVDNPRREIELVATMRSPMGGFTDSELAEIRLLSKGNFYDAFRLAARAARGSEASLALPPELVKKSKDFLQRLNAWRRLSRRSTTEAVLSRVLDDTGLLPYLSAMKGGRVRVANVQTLLERVRTFDKHSSDGVFGFVTQARELLQHEVDLGEARTLAEAEDVVRIMTIHQSKGLEFPVVFVADLGKQFYRNPMDRSLPLHRKMGFGPERIDPNRDRRWRTMPSIAIEEAETTEFLAEEARILYVALTRARERLVLVGSARQMDKRIESSLSHAGHKSQVLPTRILQKAKTPLDWLLPILWRHEETASTLDSFMATMRANGSPSVRKSGFDAGRERVRMRVVLWNVPSADGGLHTEAPVSVRDNAGRWKSSLATALMTGDDEEVLRLLAVSEITSVNAAADENEGEYAFGEPKVMDEGLKRGSPPAKISATELRRLFAARHRTTQSAVFQSRSSAEHLLEDPTWIKERKTSGRERGLAFHSVMQVIDLDTEPTDAAVSEQLRRLVDSELISKETYEAILTDDVVRFLQSSLGCALRSAGRIYREQPFFHRLDIGAAGNGQFVTVQGVMDCLAELDDKWLLIDYKTDNIEADDVQFTAAEYAAQISVYLQVAEAVIGGRKPIEAYIYFVHPATVVALQPVDVSTLFD